MKHSMSDGVKEMTRSMQLWMDIHFTHIGYLMIYIINVRVKKKIKEQWLCELNTALPCAHFLQFEHAIHLEWLIGKTWISCNSCIEIYLAS